MDLPVWQALHTEPGERNLRVSTVALDSGGAADAGPWIREANPTHPSLIDVRHLVAELYGWVNVPTIAWIDEEGRLVRPGDPGWAGDYFRRMVEPDFDHAAMMAEYGRLRSHYLDAVRDWVAHGPASRWALAPEAVRRPLAVIRGVAEHDLGRPRRLEIEADVVLVGHADAAVHLDRLVADEHVGVGAARLGGSRHAGHVGVVGPVVEGAVRRHHRGAGELDLHVQLGGAVPEGLEAADRDTELPAGLQVFQRHLEGGRHAAQHFG